MSKTIAKKAAEKKSSIQKKLDDARKLGDYGKPILELETAEYGFSERVNVCTAGGIPLVKAFLQDQGLAKAIDDKLELLSAHRPYYESDHILNMAFNVLAGGENLEDIEILRKDESYLNSLGVEVIPDPTTTGDFCRRFDVDSIMTVQRIFNDTRVKAWKRQDDDFFQIARIDSDGVLVNTTGECKEGMDINYKGDWGYHPLLISLANTQEPLFIINRPGNVKSRHNAGDWMTEAARLCSEAGFHRVLLRGDTDFAISEKLDEWTEEGIGFVFGKPVNKAFMKKMEEEEDSSLWEELQREVKLKFERERPENVKQELIEIRGYKDLKLRDEKIFEFQYTPVGCQKEYRVVALKKTIDVFKSGQKSLLPDIRYFFYITNDFEMPMEEVVKEANDRCAQENTVNQQLQSGTHSLKAPLNDLEANWAWMVITSLAWNTKIWMALSLPVMGRWEDQHGAEKHDLLTMEMKRFIRTYMQIPVMVVHQARKLILKICGWRPGLAPLMRLRNALE